MGLANQPAAIQLASEPTSQAIGQPASQPFSKSGNQADGKLASQPINWRLPNSRLASRPADQLSRQPGSQSASQLASNPIILNISSWRGCLFRVGVDFRLVFWLIFLWSSLSNLHQIGQNMFPRTVVEFCSGKGHAEKAMEL